MMPRALAGTMVAIIVLASAATVCAAELRLIVASSMAPAIKDLVPRFERATGHTAAVTVVPGSAVKRAIDTGGPFDVAISTTAVVDGLIADGALARDTRVDVAYAAIGVGIPVGAPKPDIGTVDGFRRALLAAGSVAHSAQGESGAHFKSVLERLGIAAAMAPKLRPLSSERLAQAVPSGAADMVVVTMPVIVAYGTQLVGPVPAALQFYNRYAAAIGTGAREPVAARGFLDFLTGAAAAKSFEANGMRPGTP